MSDKVAFELVSPEKLLFSGEVDMVVLPASEGDMGVLPGHSPVISNIRPGTICIYDGAKVDQRLFVAGGFAEITQERCTVLAETATPIDQIDTAAVKSEIKDLSSAFSQAKSDNEKSRAEAALAIAEARLQAAQAPAYQ